MLPTNNGFQDIHPSAYPINFSLLNRATFTTDHQSQLQQQQLQQSQLQAQPLPIDEHNGATSMMLAPRHNFMEQQYQDQQDFFQAISQVNFEPAASFNAYLAPKKHFEYLGQREEQNYQDSKVVVLPDFEFNRSTQFNLLPTQSYHFDQIFNPHHHHHQSNNPLPDLPNPTTNLIFSTFQNNPAVDLTDLFPPRQAQQQKTSPTGQLTVLQNSQQFFIDDFRDNLHQNNQEPSPLIKAREIPPHQQNNINNINNINNHHTLESPRFCNQSLQFSTFIGNSCFALNPKTHLSQLQSNQPAPQISNQLFMCMRTDDNDDNSHCSEAIGQIQEMPTHSAPTKKVISKQKAKSISKKETSEVFTVLRDNQADKKKKKDQDKNICRYITRQVIRSLTSPEFKSRVLQIIAEISESPYTSTQNKPQSILSTYKAVTDFFLGEIENISGFRVLKDMLLLNESVDSPALTIHKRVFREFMRWYLKERYFRAVLQGNMTDKLSFIRYKNKIMLHYINNPLSWNSNKTKRITAKQTSSFPPSLHNIQ